MPNHSPTQLFEVSWEVANKVGGIHTVITSKLLHAQANFPGHYCAVGPFLGNQDNPEFLELSIPLRLKGVSQSLLKEGIILHYGRWLVKGRPETVLLEWSGLKEKVNEIKTDFWQKFKLDTLGSDPYEVDEPLLWSVAVGKFLETYQSLTSKPVLVQAHEWLSAGLFLHLKSNSNTNIKTVFTTHATVLGRALSGYKPGINPDEEALSRSVSHKHHLEKLAANLATVFTTVSHLTAQEATDYLGREPDVITENGLDLSALPSTRELILSKQKNRSQLEAFTAAYFFPSQYFELEKTRFSFTMGRNETHNKGFDLIVESLAHLNQQLQSSASDQQIIHFFLVPLHNSLPLSSDTVQRLATYKNLTKVLKKQQKDHRNQLYGQIWNHTAHYQEPLFNYDDFSEHNLSENPPTCPFTLESEPEIISLLQNHNLRNSPNDRVKVVLLPLYLDGNDGLFDLPLYELIRAFDLGIFPSRYEPWGYTPLECLSMAVPAITSLESGFGQAALPFKGRGVSFIKPNSPQAKEELAQLIEDIADLSPEKAFQEELQARRTAEHFDWKRLYRNYEDAYQLALKEKESCEN